MASRHGALQKHLTPYAYKLTIVSEDEIISQSTGNAKYIKNQAFALSVDCEIRSNVCFKTKVKCDRWTKKKQRTLVYAFDKN